MLTEIIKSAIKNLKTRMRAACSLRHTDEVYYCTFIDIHSYIPQHWGCSTSATVGQSFFKTFGMHVSQSQQGLLCQNWWIYIETWSDNDKVWTKRVII
jgi:hypothetical protein